MTRSSRLGHSHRSAVEKGTVRMGSKPILPLPCRGQGPEHPFFPPWVARGTGPSGWSERPHAPDRLFLRPSMPFAYAEHGTRTIVMNSEGLVYRKSEGIEGAIKRLRVIAESLIVAVATWMSPAQYLSASPTRVGEIGLYASLPYSQISATGPIRCPVRQTLLTQAQPLTVTPVSLGPAIDMDNRRRDEDEAKRRQQEQELREQARREQEFRQRAGPYSYAYPPFPDTYPPQGYYYDRSTGHYYQYGNNGSTYNSNSGQYYQPYYYQPPGYSLSE